MVTIFSWTKIKDKPEKGANLKRFIRIKYVLVFVTLFTKENKETEESKIKGNSTKMHILIKIISNNIWTFIYF